MKPQQNVFTNLIKSLSDTLSHVIFTLFIKEITIIPVDLAAAYYKNEYVS